MANYAGIGYKYKGINYWYNDLQGKWLAQIGYEIIASAKSEGAIKAQITRYVKDW